MEMNTTDIIITATVGTIISAVIVIAWIVIDICAPEVIEMLFFVMSMSLGVIFSAAIWMKIKEVEV